MKNSLLDAFDIKNDPISYENKKDYDIFPDKKLLDDLRNQIINNLIDKSDNNINTSESINTEIDAATVNADLSILERNYLYNLINDELYSMGPLTELMNDPNITTIMVNSPQEIYFESDGQIFKDETVSFIDSDHIMRTLEKILLKENKSINEVNSFIDIKLPDGSRLNAILPPLSFKGPVLTITKKSVDLKNLEDLIREGSLTQDMANFLGAAVKAKLNIIVCGGSGSGKTALINILGNYFAENERIVTIENISELDIKHNNTIGFETNNLINNLPISQLLRNIDRMKPDRIIMGEINPIEALDVIQSFNSGHEGSIASIYANSCKDAIARLEAMIIMNSPEIPIAAIRSYIASSIDLIIDIEKLSDGKKKIVSISEITGITSGIISLETIFKFRGEIITEKNEINGQFVINPKICLSYKKIKSKGINDIDYIFSTFRG